MFHIHGGLLVFGLDNIDESPSGIWSFTGSSSFVSSFASSAAVLFCWSSCSSSSWTEESGADGIVGKNLTLSLGEEGSWDSSWNADWRTKRGLPPREIDWRLESGLRNNYLLTFNFFNSLSNTYLITERAEEIILVYWFHSIVKFARWMCWHLWRLCC